MAKVPAALGFVDPPEQQPYGSAGPGLVVKSRTDPTRRQGWLGQLRARIAEGPSRRNLRALGVMGLMMQDMGDGSHNTQDYFDHVRQVRAQEADLAWQQQQRQQQQGAWNDAEKRGIRLNDWAQTQGPEAQIDPASAFQAQQQASALAHQPMTPFQQRQLEQDQSQFGQQQATTRRGQDLDLMAAGLRAQAGGGMARLRGPDASQMTRIQQAGEAARSLQQYADQFEAANQHTGSGPVGQYTQYFNGNQAVMRQTSSLMRGLMRPIGSGATSDYEQRLYAQGAPDPGLLGPANQARINNIRALAAINSARQFFYEDFADQNGSLRGAERAFQQSQEFIDLTGGNHRGSGNGSGRSAPRADVRIDANGRIIQ